MFRQSIVRQAKERGFRDWSKFKAILASSPAIYCGRHGFGAILSLEAELTEALAFHAKDQGVSVLVESLADPNPILCGYAIEMLDMIGLARCITPETHSRRVRCHLPMRRMELSLGELAAIVVSTS
jgi:hypothetical protein